VDLKFQKALEKSGAFFVLDGHIGCSSFSGLTRGSSGKSFYFWILGSVAEDDELSHPHFAKMMLATRRPIGLLSVKS